MNKQKEWKDKEYKRIEKNMADVKKLYSLLLEFETDTKREERKKQHMCRTCTYFNNPKPFDRSTNHCYHCNRGISKEHVFCKDCAKELQLCVRCGGTDGEEPNYPADHWVRRKIEDATYENKQYVQRLKKQLDLYQADSLKDARIIHHICQKCYYVDEYHKVEIPVLNLKSCLGCDNPQTSPKGVPLAFCPDCADAHHACSFCGQPLEEKRVYTID